VVREVGREKKRREKSQRKISEMLGKWGKAGHNALAHRDLCASPHFARKSGVGEVGGKWGSRGEVGKWGSGEVGKWGSGVGVFLLAGT
jgi:hypothetical protein